MDGSAPSDLDAAHPGEPGTVPPHARPPAPPDPAGPEGSPADPIRTSPARWPNIADFWPDAPENAAAAVVSKETTAAEGTTPAAGPRAAATPAAGVSVTARFASRVSVTLSSVAPGAVAPGAVTPGGAPTGAVTAGAAPTGAGTPGTAPTGAVAGAEPVGDAMPAREAGSADTPATHPAPRRHRPDAAPTGVPAMPAMAGAGSGAYPVTVLGPPARPGRHRLRMLVALVGAAVFLGVSALVLVRMVARPEPDPVAQAPAGDGGIVVGSPSPPVSIAPAPTSAATPSVGPSAPSASPGARPPGPAFPAGTFVLAGDLTELNVSVGRPPQNGIARVFSPRDSGVRPRADVDGSTVRLTSEPTGEHGSGQVDVLLDERIAWTITMDGGVRRGVFAMVGSEVRGFELDGGADRLVMTLPRQADPIPIRMSGGVHTWRIRTDGRVPVTAVLRRGAGEVELNGDRERGVDKGETLRASGRGDGSGGVRVEAVAGVGSLTVEPLHQGD